MEPGKLGEPMQEKALLFLEAKSLWFPGVPGILRAWSRICQRPESVLLSRGGLFRPLWSLVVMEPGELGVNTREGACCFRSS